jgi:hypothetical protein
MPTDDVQEPQSTSWNLLAKVLAVTIVILLLGIGGETYYLYRVLHDHPVRVDPLPELTVPLPKNPQTQLSCSQTD